MLKKQSPLLRFYCNPSPPLFLIPRLLQISLASNSCSAISRYPPWPCIYLNRSWKCIQKNFLSKINLTIFHAISATIFNPAVPAVPPLLPITWKSWVTLNTSPRWSPYQTITKVMQMWPLFLCYLLSQFFIICYIKSTLTPEMGLSSNLVSV